MSCTCKPGKALCRSCLNQTSTPYVGNAVGNDGNYTTHQIDVFQKQFEKTIAADVISNPLTAAVSKYGRKSFYNAVEKINTDFLKRDYIVSILPDYDILNLRVARGPITPLEFASFIKNSNYTPSNAIISSNAKGARFCNELNDYYNGDFSDSVMGGFCGLFGSIFGAYNAFFDLVDSVGGLIDDVQALITKIKNIENPLKAIFEAIKVKALLEAIKSKIEETIRKTIEATCRAISNFNVEAITGPLNTPVKIKIAEKTEEKKSALQEFCGEDNLERILEKIRQLISYASNLFENPSLEEIMFLIARICALATGVEGLIKGLKDPLDDFANRYDEVFNTIRNASNRVTGEAIRAGAFRLAEPQRQEQINNAREPWTAAGNIAPTTSEEVKGLPKWEALKAGTDARLKIQGGWVTSMVPASEGWTEMPVNMRVMVMRLQIAAKEAGIANHLILNSGYRNPVYNEAVDGAKASQHLSGSAADLTWNGFRGRSSELDEFVSLARTIGFTGIGYYNGFVHVDVGRERYWDKRT